MPWNEADRAKYEVIRDRCSSDTSGAEFELILPLLSAPKKRARKSADFRVVPNAAFSMIRVGCPWRLSPKDFPPFTTVQNRFHAWRDRGLWPEIIGVLAMAAPAAEGRQPTPTAVVVDSRSVETRESRRAARLRRGQERQRRRCAEIKDRKRHIAVDTTGLPIECQIAAAGVQDRAALAPLLGGASQEPVGDDVLCRRRLSGRGGATGRLRGEPHFHHGPQTHGQTTHGVRRLAEKAGRRTNAGLDQSRATPVEGLPDPPTPRDQAEIFVNRSNIPPFPR